MANGPNIFQMLLVYSLPTELLLQGGGDVSGYGAGYGDAGVTGYDDPNAAAGYGTAAGEGRLVYCSKMLLPSPFN